MGLDMFIFKHKRFENATLDDVMAVEYYLDLEQYKKEHPDCKYTMEEWCGKQKPADNLIEFFGKLCGINILFDSVVECRNKLCGLCEKFNTLFRYVEVIF